MTRRLDRPRSLGRVGDEIAAVIGHEKTVALIRGLPQAGSRPWRRCFYVPARMPIDHDIVRLIGLLAAEKLSAAFGGSILQPANPRRVWNNQLRARVVQAFRAGARASQISRDLEVPRSTVVSILSREGLR